MIASLYEQSKSYLGTSITDLRIRFYMDALSDYVNEIVHKTQDKISIFEDRDKILTKLLSFLQEGKNDNVLDWFPREVAEFYLIHLSRK